MLTFRTSFALIVSLLLSACASSPQLADSSMAQMRGAAEMAAADRFVIRSASVHIDVNEPAATAAEIQSRVQALGGFVENSWSGETRINLSVKVPEPDLENFVDAVAALGDLQSKSYGSFDVTEEMIDIDARLRNLYALRDRLRELLQHAETVADIVAIEAELSRIQSEIDSIESRRNALKNQVEFSRVDITLEQQTIYGPLGYVAKGLYWVIEKLFVIRP